MTVSSLYSHGLQSADLNPVEHCWEVVEQEIYIMDVQLNKSAATAKCCYVSVNQNLQHLVRSM